MYDEDVYKNKMTIFYGVLLKSYYIIIIYIIFYIIIHYAIYWKFLANGSIGFPINFGSSYEIINIEDPLKF